MELRTTVDDAPEVAAVGCSLIPSLPVDIFCLELPLLQVSAVALYVTAHPEYQHTHSTTQHGTGAARRGRNDGRLPVGAVVLRDACVYALVDDGRAECLRAGAMPHHLALPALLQRPRCLL